MTPTPDSDSCKTEKMAPTPTSTPSKLKKNDSGFDSDSIKTKKTNSTPLKNVRLRNFNSGSTTLVLTMGAIFHDQVLLCQFQ